MKNQDPTDPVDASEQMSQLASFSQVEQTIQTNTKLDTLLASSSLTQAGSYIGKYMESADGTVKGIVASVKVYSDGIIATTNDGGKILVQAGVTIADSAPASSDGDSRRYGRRVPVTVPAINERHAVRLSRTDPPKAI